MINNNRSPGNNSILFDFDSIIDIKIGFIKYLKKNFPDSKMINHLFINNDDDFLKYYHVDIYNDMIEMCFQGLTKENTHKIYKEAIEKDYEEIISLSPQTTMAMLINRYKIAGEGAIRSTVLCKNQIEKQYISNILPGTSVRIEKDRQSTDFSNYGRIVCAYCDHALEFNDPRAMNFLILNFRENFEEDKPNQLTIKMIAELGDVNEFEYCLAYNDLKEYEG